MPEELKKLKKGADDAFFEKLRTEVSVNAEESDEADEEPEAGVGDRGA
jgi:hypothetical protein